ncbi:MAG: SsrA-binding protein SmpB [Acidobacteria bacterium]|nr:SsrA-binding protein SmpB [Acidobacteriota bacterium]
MEKPDRFKILADNRKARHDYFFLETFEAGIVLSGTEVKSAKAGKVQLRDAYAAIKNNEIWLHNAHISHYEHGNRWNHEAVTVRKLLIHRHEIDKLVGKTREKGQTLVPTKMYLKNGRVKVEIALAKGKQNYDKRETIKKREADAEARAAIVRARRS